MRKVDAQQARRILDRLVGYNLSPLLWRKVRKGLSAGRVQSVAVRLVVEREREIKAFNPQEYWSISGLFSTQEKEKEQKSFKAILYKYKGKLIINRDKKEFLLKEEKDALKLIKKIEALEFSLKDIQKRVRKKNPPSPFITSTLQQEASRKLRFTPKKTMMIAQQLYEGIELGEEGSVGLITYMRTDSIRISDEAQEAAKEYIIDRYGSEYVLQSKGKKKTKKAAKVQDAHEAIRPTYLNKPPEEVKKYLTRDQYSLYRLIWRRFIASQMAPAEIEHTTFIITDQKDKVEFRATGDVIRFKGYTVLYSDDTEIDTTNGDLSREDSSVLPILEKDTGLELKEINAHQHFTQPPPRYTEASLIKALEEKGIGRPSTYATIITTILQRKYIKKEEGKLVPTTLGELVNDLLVERFPELMDVGFTAKMENDLDGIEEGKSDWVKVVSEFYGPFSKELNDALKTLGRIKPKDEKTEVVCESCGKPMVKRWGRHGWFLACSGFPECKTTKPLEEEKEKNGIEVTDKKCPECGSEMVIRQGRYGRFLACSKYPECKTTMPLGTGVKCPLDGGEIVERKSKKGKIFWSCSNWPDCRFASWHKPVAEPCPECGAEFLLEKKDKEGKTILYCQNKHCKYKKTMQTEEAAVNV
jgi:DNA topoisomerase-1